MRRLNSTMAWSKVKKGEVMIIKQRLSLSSQQIISAMIKDKKQKRHELLIKHLSPSVQTSSYHSYSLRIHIHKPQIHNPSSFLFNQLTQIRWDNNINNNNNNNTESYVDRIKQSRNFICISESSFLFLYGRKKVLNEI